MLKLGRLYCTCRGFDSCGALRKCSQLFTWKIITKHLAFLYSINENIAQILKPLILAISLSLSLNAMSFK